MISIFKVIFSFNFSIKIVWKFQWSVKNSKVLHYCNIAIFFKNWTVLQYCNTFSDAKILQYCNTDSDYWLKDCLYLQNSTTLVNSISRNALLKSCARLIIERSEIRKKQHDFKSVHFECRMVLFYTIWEKSRL